MPIITAMILSGRTREQKRMLIQQVTQAAVTTLSVQPQQVRVIIQEIAPEHWGSGGVTKIDAEGGA